MVPKKPKTRVLRGRVPIREPTMRVDLFNRTTQLSQQPKY